MHSKIQNEKCLQENSSLINNQKAMQKEKQASASTNYRYKLANRSKDVSLFCQFRNEYQNYITDSQISDLKQVYQHGICGKIQSGHLVVVDRVGAVKMNEVNKVLDEDQIVGYFNQRLLNISEKMLEQKQQVIWIIDLHGKIMQLASKKLLTLLSKIIKNSQTYFPHLLYKMYFVNTPMLFDTIWNKFSPEIAQQTQEKIVMLSDQLDLLYEDVNNQLIPEFLGGDLPDDVFLRDSVQQEQKQYHAQQDEPEENENKSQESQEQKQFDFASLKQALSSMQMGGLTSVNQTPLNTEADDN